MKAETSSTSAVSTPSPALIAAVSALAKTVTCPICMDFMESPVTLSCSHSYCQQCLCEMLKSTIESHCPLCNSRFLRKDISCIMTDMEPIISSIRDFVATFEGKPLPSLAEKETVSVDDKFIIQRPGFRVGDLVHVAPRLWPGINKPGGTAWIQDIEEDVDGNFYDCRYVLGNNIDLRVPAAYIRSANDINEERESRRRRSKVPNSKPSKGNAPVDSEAMSGSSKKRRKSQFRDSNIEENEEENSDTKSAEEATPSMAFLCSTLSAEELTEVRKFCDTFPNAAIHDSYSDSISHIIVHAERKGKGKNQSRILKNRTMKYMQGVLGHKWIVSIEWIIESLQKKRLICEGDFEVSRDNKADSKTFGPKWSRLRTPGGLLKLKGQRIFDVACKYVFSGPFCHPGPTLENLSGLVVSGGGNTSLTMSEVVDAVNVSLDGGLRVKNTSPLTLQNAAAIVIVSSESSGNEFSKQLFLSISSIRKERRYDFGDFVDHISGMFCIMTPDWIFDCISNYSFADPLHTNRFRITLDRNASW